MPRTCYNFINIFLRGVWFLFIGGAAGLWCQACTVQGHAEVQGQGWRWCGKCDIWLLTDTSLEIKTIYCLLTQILVPWSITRSRISKKLLWRPCWIKLVSVLCQPIRNRITIFCVVPIKYGNGWLWMDRADWPKQVAEMMLIWHCKMNSVTTINLQILWNMSYRTPVLNSHLPLKINTLYLDCVLEKGLIVVTCKM